LVSYFFVLLNLGHFKFTVFLTLMHGMSTAPVPVAPSICKPTPQPTPKPFTFISPAPTFCEEQRFFYINGLCTNDIFLIGGTAYMSAQECCNVHYGPGSFPNGGCDFIDTCNTYTATNPPTTGSTPTVSTEVTGPPTTPDRRGNDQGGDEDNDDN
jgi:hypothetical protein